MVVWTNKNYHSVTLEKKISNVTMRTEKANKIKKLSKKPISGKSFFSMEKR